jgi:hypothetical protein
VVSNREQRVEACHPRSMHGVIVTTELLEELDCLGLVGRQ